MDIKGKACKITEDGYLQNPEDWNREIADCIARREGIVMTDIHWKMVDFLRGYYYQNKDVPPVKILAREMEKKTGCLRWDKKYLEQLYPAGPSRKLCKISGLPKTAGEIVNATVLGGGVLV